MAVKPLRPLIKSAVELTCPSTGVVVIKSGKPIVTAAAARLVKPFAPPSLPPGNSKFV